MNQQIENSKLHGLRRIAEILVYLFAAECVFGGSGRLLSIGGISIRMILFALAFCATAPFAILKWKELLRNPTIIAAVVLGVAVVVSTGIGLLNGNAFGFIWADISSFLTLALLPGMFAVMDEEKKLHKLLDVVFYASVAVAAVTTALHIGLAWMDDVTINLVNDWINARSLGGFAMLATHINRVYFRAQIFLQFSILIGVWKLWATKAIAKRIVLFLCEGLMLFAVIASYTRSFWIGFALSAVVVLFLEWKNWKKLFSTAAIALALMVAIAGISTVCYGQPYVFVEIVNRFDSDLIVLSADVPEETAPNPGTETVPSETEEVVVPVETEPVDTTMPTEEIDIVAEANENAVNMRKDSLAALNKNIAEHPIMGSGLGTNLDGVREDGKTEYMYQDLMMKMGLIGLIVFAIAYFMTSVIHVFRRMKTITKDLSWQDSLVLNSFIVAGYIGVAVTSAFNPFLTTPMGILLLIITNLSVMQKKNASQDENQ